MNKEDEIIKYLEEHRECYDRFTFDANMQYLLEQGFDHEEAKDLILSHCEMSALTFQERIHNDYYLKISVNGMVSDDLMEELLEKKRVSLNVSLRNSNRLS